MFILKLSIPGCKTLVHYNTQKSHGGNEIYGRIILNTGSFGEIFTVSFAEESEEWGEMSN